MKRLILIASLAIAAVAIVPVASASAAFTGTCEIKGEATFYKAGGSDLASEEEALPLETPAPRNYKFNSPDTSEKEKGESGGTCKGNEGATYDSAEVKGEGDLACARSKGAVVLLGESTKGSGQITINAKEDLITRFGFVGLGAAIVFEAEGENVKGVGGTGPATGTASFAKNPKAVKECLEGKAKKLTFDAVTTGEFK